MPPVLRPSLPDLGGGNFTSGRPLPTGLIRFWWDMLVVAAFRQPRDTMMVLVEKQAATHGEAASTAGAG